LGLEVAGWPRKSFLNSIKTAKISKQTLSQLENSSMTKVLTVVTALAVCAAVALPADAARKKARKAAAPSAAALADAPHTARFERGFVCYTDHYHYGSSSGQANRAAATTAAVGSWQSFVDLEYGSAWARFSKAGSKRVTCEDSAGGWGCNVEARPCK
jgi:hypothetical protein